MSAPKTIGKYQITGLLGTGGQGQVHKALDADLGREVAIKSLHSSLGGDTSSVDRFRSEAKSLARIIHSNITTLIDFFAIDNHLYMIMELVHGRTLDDILHDRGKGLGQRESLAIIAQAADGLAYAHQMGVIHRDIKPSNIMITASGRVKIMDFGIARVRGSDRLTRVGSAVGTPLYMSPEQCMGSDGDERSDIYSLAIVLYELLAGAPPFQGSTDHQLSQAHIKSPPPPLIPRIAGVTPQVESALMRALEKRPENRFASMRAFSDALGANALLANSTDIIQSHASLVEESTASREAARSGGLSSLILATAKSRGATLVRRFKTLHPAIKGLSVGMAGFSILATIMLWPIAPKPIPDYKSVNQTSGNGGRTIDTRIDSRQGTVLADTAPKRPVCGGTIVSGCDWPKAPAQETKILPGILEKPHTVNSETLVEKTESKPIEKIEKVQTPPAPSIADLRKELDSQNFGKAFDLAKTLAKFDRNGEGGDREAQYALGRLFLRGLGGAENSPRKAFDWYEKSASQGHALAQYQTGFILWAGLISNEFDCLALQWFQKAADQRVAPAQYSLGLLYEKGSCGLGRNREEAVRLYKLAADQRNEDAIDALKKLGRR